MESELWTHWKELAIITGVILSILGLFLNFYALLKNLNHKRLVTYFDIIKSHRELWFMTILHPKKLGRIVEENPNIKANPVTYEERRFIQLILLHITATYNFSKKNNIVKIEELKADVDSFLKLPIPNIVWFQYKKYFNTDFVSFIEKKVERKWYWKLSQIFKMEKSKSNNLSWKVLVISCFPDKITHIFQNIFHDEIILMDGNASNLSAEFIKEREIDFIVIFGSSKIIKKDILDLVPVINVHGGFLPYNRGPNPNLWAWLDDTPKGVTIHYVDEGIDTGDIIAQKKIDILSTVSLNESFNIVVQECVDILEENWDSIRSGKNNRIIQKGKGTKHSFKDQEKFKDLFTENNMNLPINDFLDLIRNRLSNSS